MCSDGDTAVGSACAGWVKTRSDTEPDARLRIGTSSEPDPQAGNLTFTRVLIRFPELTSGVSPNMCRKCLSHLTRGFHFPFIP